MYSDLEHTLIGELDDVASNLVVPPLPNLPVTSSGRRPWHAVHVGRVDRFAPFLVAAAAVVLALAVTLGPPQSHGPVLAPAPSPTRDPASAEPKPSPTRDPASAEPKLISYDGDGSGPAEVRTTADAKDLAGAPDSFKKFIGRTAERLTKGTTCEEGYIGVTVKSLRTDGYAVGAVHECGGYVAMWAIVDGDWKEIDATQDLWDCAVLEEYRVPSDIAGDTCYDDDAQAQHSYQQA